MLKGFKQFILRGNVVDLAVGVVIGASFGNLVTALVKDILTPFIGVIAQVPDFSGLSFSIRGSQFFYGDFLNVFIAFLLVSATIYFFVITPMNTFITKVRKGGEDETLTTRKCSECLSDIPKDAKRCAYCTELVV